MIVKEVMNKAIAVDHDISIKQAAKILTSKGIGSLVVIKGGNIFGILTEKDIVKNSDNLNKKISTIMTKQIITINQEENLDNAVILMAKYKIKRLPVVNDNEKLVGIITSTDLLAHSDDLNEGFFLD